MKREGAEFRRWAREEFRSAELGDARRTLRLVKIAERAAERPGGRISYVFPAGAERQAAYDFVEADAVDAAAIVDAMGAAAASRADGLPYAVVAIDGTGLSLLDKVQDASNEKGFGPVGAVSTGVRGLKVMTALAISPSGVPLGIAGMNFWTRPQSALSLSRAERAKRKLGESEIGRWATVLEESQERFSRCAPDTKPWFQLDRGGDARRLLQYLRDGRYLFTVRARSDRNVGDYDTGQKLSHRSAKKALARATIRGVLRVSVPGNASRRARVARIVIRAAPLTLRLRNECAWKVDLFPLVGVWACEEGTTPAGESAIEWVLWTSYAVESKEDAFLVVRNYTLRWRIEEFHKTWKSGACNVEHLQLRSVAAATRWATVLAAVAARIERLKQLARHQPELPASQELTPFEQEALVLLKRRFKKRNEEIDDAPTIAKAVRWIADLGGYVGAKSSGPPGSIVIARGLAQVAAAAHVIEQLHAAGKLR